MNNEKYKELEGPTGKPVGVVDIKVYNQGHGKFQTVMEVEGNGNAIAHAIDAILRNEELKPIISAVMATLLKERFKNEGIL